MIGDLLQTLLRLVAWIFLVVCGFVFVASLVLAGLLLAAVWGVRALWAQLTGRPVRPFAGVRYFDLRTGFDRFTRRPGPQPGAQPPSERAGAHRLDDVTDVEIKSERPRDGDGR